MTDLFYRYFCYFQPKSKTWKILRSQLIHKIVGLETGERNVVCHVIRLNEITFEFQSALNPGNKDFGTFLERHGDAVKDIAFNCTDVDALLLKVV